MSEINIKIVNLPENMQKETKKEFDLIFKLLGVPDDCDLTNFELDYDDIRASAVKHNSFLHMLSFVTAYKVAKLRETRIKNN